MKHTKGKELSMPVDVAIEAAAADGASPSGPPKFSTTAYNGGALKLNGWSLPVVVDLSGLSYARTIVANKDHDSKQIVGHVTEKTNDGKSLQLSGLVSGTGAAAQEVLANNANSFPWQASIEARPDKVQFVAEGKRVTVNGREFEGPLYVAAKATLYGVAFLPRGADEDTSVTIAAEAASQKEIGMELKQWIEAMGFNADELTDQQKAKLTAKYEAEVKAAAKDGDVLDITKIVAAPAFDLEDLKAACTEHSNELEIIFAKHEDEVPRAKFVDLKAAALKELKAIKEKALAEKWPATRYEVEAIRASSKAHLEFIKAAAPQGPAIHSSTRDATPDVIEAAMCISLGTPNLEKHFKEPTLEAAHRNFRNIGLQQVMIMAAAANGYTCRPGERLHTGNLRDVLEYAFPRGRDIRAASTISLPGVFSNVANKELLTGYQEADQTWREIAVVKTVNDFKAVTSYRLLDDMEYEELGPGGEIKHGRLGEETFTRQAKTYAKMFALKREDIINDDMGAFDDLRNRLGGGAAKKFNNLFWTKFLNNASFFTTARGNLVTGTDSALSSAGLSKAVLAFRQMKSSAADGAKRIGGRPVMMLVPPELEPTADELYTSKNINTGGSSTKDKVPNGNTHVGKYRPVVCDWLSDADFSGYSSTAYYMFREKSQLAAVTVSFLNGMQTPTVDSADADFDQLGVQFRGYHDFGVDLGEYLAGIKVTGVAP
jgi:phage major head subunit gpT-like protein